MSKVLPRSMLPAAEYAIDATNEIKGVLEAFGHEAGHYSVLGPDPWQVVWNGERTGFVSFLEGRRCLLAWRSPVARPEDQPEVLARLADYAERISKSFFAIEVNETTRRAGDELGMTPIWTGTESFLDLPAWSTQGGKRQKVRWARSHAAKLGFTWREAFPVNEDADYKSLARVEELWRDERQERRTDSFLRTAFMEVAELRRYFVAERGDVVDAFVACTPVNRHGWYLQDVVRSPEAPRGALEGAMALALDTFRDEGFEFASNGPLPFWRPHESFSDAYQLGAIGNHVLKFFDGQYRFSGINQFRSKFEPDRVEPLYVIRSRKLITPNVGRSLTKLLNQRLP